jgi:hypothetical protein
METASADTCPQRAEGITACRWAPFEDAVQLTSYANARVVLKRAHDLVTAVLRAGSDEEEATAGR